MSLAAPERYAATARCPENKDVAYFTASAVFLAASFVASAVLSAAFLVPFAVPLAASFVASAVLSAAFSVPLAVVFAALSVPLAVPLAASFVASAVLSAAFSVPLAVFVAPLSMSLPTSFTPVTTSCASMAGPKASTAPTTAIQNFFILSLPGRVGRRMRNSSGQKKPVCQADMPVIKDVVP